MGVKMTGGSSGNRESALPNISVNFDRQVPQDTSKSSYPDPGVKLVMADENRHIAPQNPPVPSCGTPDDGAV